MHCIYHLCLNGLAFNTGCSKRLIRISINFAQRLSKAERAVTDREFGALLPALELMQQLLPAFRALAIAIHHADGVLVASFIGSNDHQDALLVMFHARREIDPVGPEIDVAFGPKIELLPGEVLFPPDRLQPANRAGCQTRCIRTQQGGQGLAQVAAGYPLQVKPGQQLLHRFGAPAIARQDRRGEADATARRTRIAITHLRRLDPDRANPGLDLASRQITVADNPAPALGVGPSRMRRDMALDFNFHRPGQPPITKIQL